MSQHRTRLTPAVVLVALLAATPALPQTHRSTAPRTASFGEIVRGFLPDFLTRLWDSATPSGDLGCVIDPYGRCSSASAAAARPPLTSVSGDLGCSADPYGGHCGAVAQTPPPTGH
jgi:hypothetical protein